MFDYDYDYSQEYREKHWTIIVKYSLRNQHCTETQGTSSLLLKKEVGLVTINLILIVNFWEINN